VINLGIINCSYLETHVVHECTLKCYGCNHFSDLGLSRGWRVRVQDFETMVKFWSARLNPSTFILLGGEPTLHPQLEELLLISSKYFRRGSYDDIGENCSVSFTTNGTLLHKHKNIKQIIKDNNISIVVSIHPVPNKLYNVVIENIKMVHEWMDEGITAKVWDFTKENMWIKPYKSYGKKMEPFQNIPRDCWRECDLKVFYQLLNGCLYKCPTVAYLPLIKEKHPDLSDKWQPVLNYKPLSPNCTRQELIQFLQKEEEDVCGLCLNKRDRSSQPDNYKN